LVEPLSGDWTVPRAKARRVIAWIFLASALLYLFTAGANFSGGDSYSELHVTESLVTHHGVDVPILKAGQVCAGWGCRGADGRFYASHAIGYSIFLLPFYLTARLAIAVTSAPNCNDWVRCIPIHLISWNTCLVTAATVALLAQFALDLGYGIRRSTFLALLYGFASMAWPYARFGFDVTLTALCLLAAVRSAWLAINLDSVGIASKYRWLEAGTYCALAVLVRLPSIVAIAPLILVALTKFSRQRRTQALTNAAVFALPLAGALVFSAWYNWTRFGGILDDGHRMIAANHLSTTPWVGVLGLLISPGKGIIWYCPLVVVAAWLAPEFFIANRTACVMSYAVALTSLLPYAVLNDWYGGAAWGPRYFLPVLPLLLLPLLRWPERLQGKSARVAMFSLLAISVVVQCSGQLVNYADRLAVAGSGGYADAIYWDPGHSPLLDHLGTLITYITHLDAMRSPVPVSQTFDIWWLDLWRIDGVDPAASVAAGFLIAVACLSAWVKLYTLLQDARPSRH
jgi:hypothetical protein